MTTTIDLGVQLTAASDLPVLGDFRTYFQSISDVVAIWRFDRSDLLTLASGKISQANDWLGGAAILPQATDAKRGTLVYDATLGRNVMSLSRAAGANYTQSGGSAMDNANPWTMIVVHKPATYDFGTVAQIGATSALITTTSGGNPVLSAGTGGTAIADQPQSVTGWNRHVASHPGGNSIRQQIGGRSILTNTGGAVPTGAGLVIGNNTPAAAYGGSIDLIMAIKSQDILADPTSDFYLNVKAFLDARGV